MRGPSPWVTTYLPLASTIVVAGATVVLVWLTSGYVRLTARMFEESQRSRDPLVTVDFEILDRSIRLVLENHGLSPAKDVRITVLKEPQCLRMGRGRQGLMDCGPIKDGISYLAPSRKLKYYLGYPNWKDSSGDQMEASLRVTYKNEAGREYQHTVDFDFGQMREVLYESFKDSDLAVAEAIRETERDRQLHERLHEYTETISGSLNARAMKKCAMCAEMIPEEAKKCALCHEMQEQP